MPLNIAVYGLCWCALLVSGSVEPATAVAGARPAESQQSEAQQPPAPEDEPALYSVWLYRINATIQQPPPDWLWPSVDNRSDTLFHDRTLTSTHMCYPR